MFTIWTDKHNQRISVETDGEKFHAVINAGVAGETFLAVAYSCPNYADVAVCEFAQRQMAKALQAAWDEVDQLDLDDMLPPLLRLCKVANEAYNNALDGYLRHRRETTTINVELTLKECWNLGYALQELAKSMGAASQQEAKDLARRLYKLYQRGMDDA